MGGFYVTSLVVHLLALAVWLGGGAFLGMVLAPVVRRPENQGVAATLFERAAMRFRTVSWICLGLIVITGFLALVSLDVSLAELVGSAFWTSDYGVTLAYKLVFVFVILALNVVHDVAVGPRAMELWRTDPDSPRTKRLRKISGWFGRGNLVLALVAIVLAVKLARGGL